MCLFAAMVGVLPRCNAFKSHTAVCDLKAAHGLRSQIREFMLYEFKPGHNAAEAAKNSYYAKS